MWRIYSSIEKDKPINEEKLGVKVKTTPESLINMLVFNVNSYKNRHPLFPIVGSIVYKEKKKIDKYAQNCKDFFINYHASFRLELALILPFMTKRDVFDHEKEVRVIYCTNLREDRDHNENINEGIARFEIDPNKLFEEIILDPRLKEKAVCEITCTLRGLGFKNKIEKSLLYEAPKFY